MSDISDISKALNFGKDYLSRSNVNDAELSAEILLAEALGLNRQSLYSHFEDKLTEVQQELYKEYISRRANHEPLQYLLGYAYFRGLKITVGPGVLIPRPETEQLVEVAIKNLKNNCNKILDLCTGSGCIACSFANEFSDVKIYGTDISEEALAYAKMNIKKHHFEEKITLVQCNMADEIYDNNFDLIISNPPYVPTDVYKNLDKEVIDYEPKLALEAGRDGASLLDEIIATAKDKLEKDGIVALEFHEDKLDLAKLKFETAGFNDCKIYKDLAGKDRILIAKN